MQGSAKIEIRDQRSRKMYRIDDSYIDLGYSRECKPAATAVYNSLCRHADPRQECFPSIDGIAEQHGMTSRTVIRATKILEKFRIIKIIRRKSAKTNRQMSNVYVLLAASEWKPIRVTKGQPAPGDTGATGPGDKNDIKPGDTGATEGSTEEKVAQREGSAAQSAAASVCVEPGCGKPRMKGVEHCTEHEPMTVSQFVAWYRRSPSRHMLIIAEWADELRQCGMAPDLRTVAQWSTWAKTIMTAAKTLEIFQDEQIAEGIKRMMAAEWTTDFNLHTVKSFILNSKKK